MKSKSITGPRVSLFILQLKKCGNNVNINMESYHKSGVITFVLAQESEYTWKTRKLCSNGARTFLKYLFLLRKFNLIESTYLTLNLILSAKLFLSLCRLLWLNPVRRTSHQPAFMGNCLTISHTCLSCLPSRWVSLCLLYPLMIELNGGLVDDFLHMVSMLLVPWGVDAILGTWYGIQGQN